MKQILIVPLLVAALLAPAQDAAAARAYCTIHNGTYPYCQYIGKIVRAYVRKDSAAVELCAVNGTQPP